MSTKSVKVGLVLVASLLLGGGVARSAGTEPSVMIVPARHTIMQFALDMVRLRGVTLITYRESKTGDLFAAYSWDAVGRRWVDVGLNEGEARGAFAGARFTVVIGHDTKPSERILSAAGWSGSLREIPTMDIAAIANELNTLYCFSPREWRWLAARYRLKIKDLNYERRRYGRYGLPSGERRDPCDPMESRETALDDGPMWPKAPVVSGDRTVRLQTPQVPAESMATDVATETPAMDVESVAIPVEEPMSPAVEQPVEEKGSAASMEEKGVPVLDEAPAAPADPAADELPEDK